MLAGAGCVTRSLPRSPSDDLFHFSTRSPTAALDFALAPAPVSKDGPAMTARVGRCTIVQTRRGQSRLFTLDDAVPLDLDTSGRHLPAPPADVGEAFVVAFITLPSYMAQPFAALPDRLADRLGHDVPASPDLVALARDLVDYKGVAATGTLAGTGVYTCRITLTDAARSRLRAALASRPTTRPA